MGCVVAGSGWLSNWFGSIFWKLPQLSIKLVQGNCSKLYECFQKNIFDTIHCSAVLSHHVRSL